MNFSTIVIKKTSAGTEVWFDKNFASNADANSAVNLGRTLGWKEDIIVVNESTTTYIFNKRG